MARKAAEDLELSGSKPPDDVTDEYCTCDLYDWPEHSCPFACEILGIDDEDYCTCCDYHYQECLYRI